MVSDSGTGGSWENQTSSLDSLSWSHAPVMGDLALTLCPTHQGISGTTARGLRAQPAHARSSGTLFDNVPDAD